ncbi:hypothetical protein [Microbulbifer sp. YPW1]|uniref:hypothetical protein n=1 Tax=Microbulbifer sp. YPW1 TaxID=2745199 RepID=UPI001598A7DF|nr:hypothetical protein [Microbulbifer sp. YPW1]QKX18085.1 hypothetical protein HUW35_14565 [Microbulbifer sp. YPW1]
MTRSPNLSKLVILDPALIAAGGHHAGFALMAAKSHKRSGAPFDLEFVCNDAIDGTLKAQLEACGSNVRPEYRLNFYQGFGESKRVSDVQSYIRQAAREYALAIKQTTKRFPGQELVFFHPSLSWEHAFSLSLALDLTKGDEGAALQLVCAMFNPGLSFDGRTLDCLTSLNFRIGFGALQQFSNVQLYASDFEQAEKYARLLNLPQSLRLHPCYLADWENLEKLNAVSERKSTDSSPGTVILYMGDAKRDKGFLDLPKLLTWLLENVADDRQFYIQFSIPWPDSELEKVAEKLTAIAALHWNVELEYRFLNESELHERLSVASMFVFNYCPETYRDKSSGFLWIVASYGLAICCIDGSWISREAARLGGKVLDCRGSKATFLGCVNKWRPGGPVRSLGNNMYRKNIYRGFWSWLQNVSKGSTI